jgi:hypothetical protein
MATYRHATRPRKSPARRGECAMHRLMPTLERLEEKLAPSACFAVTGTVDNTDLVPHGGDGSAANPYEMSSLRGAIILAAQTPTTPASPNVINLPDGDYTLSLGPLQVAYNPTRTFAQNLEILGKSETGTIIEPDPAAQGDLLLRVDPAQLGGVTLGLANLTLEHGRAGSGGGAITAGGPGDAISATNLRFFDNQSTGAAGTSSAGAISDLGQGGTGNLTLTTCVFDSNSAPNGAAGAIAFHATSSATAKVADALTVTRCTFTNNACASALGPGGGAITAGADFGAVLNITDTVFTGNSSTMGAGAVCVTGGSVAVSDSTFTNNTVIAPANLTIPVNSGGALYVDGAHGAFSVHYNRFVGNSVQAPAGNTQRADAIYNNGAAAGSSVDDNWWGTNNGPAASDLFGISANNFLELTISAVSLASYDTINSVVTASFQVDSAGNYIGESKLDALVGLPVTFTQTGGTITPIDTTIQDMGTAQANYAVAVPGVPGTASAQVDLGPPATVTVGALSAPVVTLQPQSQDAICGEYVSLTSAASGNPTPSIAWMTGGPGIPTYMYGANLSTYSFIAPYRPTVVYYAATFWNAVGFMSSNWAVIHVYAQPIVTMQPGDITAFYGGPSQGLAYFSASVNAPWQQVVWQVSTDGGATYSDYATHGMAGSSGSDTLWLQAVPSQDGDLFRAIFYEFDDQGKLVTDAYTFSAKLTVDTVPVITVQPTDQAANPGDTVTFTTAATGKPAVSVQWFVSTDRGDSFTAIPGANQPTYSFVAAAPDFGNQYEAVFANFAGAETTNRVILLVPNAATVSSVSANWGTTGSAALVTAADGLRLLPVGRNTDLPWLNVSSISLTLSSTATLLPGDVSVTGVTVANYGPVTISGSGTNYTITFGQKVSVADRVTVSVSNAAIAPFVRRLDILPGDVNDDGLVDSRDVVLIRNQVLGFNGAVPTTFGDINGDGVVDMTDYNLARQRVGTRLP